MALYFCYELVPVWWDYIKNKNNFDVSQYDVLYLLAKNII